MRDDAGSGERAPAPPSATCAPDLLLVGGPSARGTGAEVLRIRDGRVETGELRSLKEGQSVIGEVVKLSSRPEHDRLFDVEVLARGPSTQPSTSPPAADGQGPARSGPHTSGSPRKGPAKVSSEAYRSGWDAIFGKPRGEDLN